MSSAYIRNESLLLEFTMLFIKMLKNNGPKIDPVGFLFLFPKDPIYSFQNAHIDSD